ncbi:hypothetical protein MicloDRAFT_00024420 [Microvirga lotononidis]|uniref:Uncharacterized protein n=1 Tax=Microvirga lotononidis TaxID=864069 RepID=I4YXV6_9HYPH|nr:hypothetical protein MicloDRAFT_00024420 [Microvirga lotononidis]
MIDRSTNLGADVTDSMIDGSNLGQSCHCFDLAVEARWTVSTNSVRR